MYLQCWCWWNLDDWWYCGICARSYNSGKWIFRARRKWWLLGRIVDHSYGCRR